MTTFTVKNGEQTFSRTTKRASGYVVIGRSDTQTLISITKDGAKFAAGCRSNGWDNVAFYDLADGATYTVGGAE